MKAPLLPSREHQHWTALYLAALRETDWSALPYKLTEAETAVVAREKELSSAGATGEEAELLDDALYALRAFRTAWEHIDSAQ